MAAGFGVGGMIGYLIHGDREKRLLPKELIGVQWDLTRPLTFEEKVAQALAKLPRQNGPDYFLRMAKYTAFGGATAFTALAVYTSWVEQPVRLELEADNANADDALKQWKRSNSRAMPIQLCLATFTGLQGLAIVYRSGGDRIWLLGSLLMLANLPYTYFCIMPLNKKLMARDDSPHNNADDEEDTTRNDLQRWGKLHRVRLVIGIFTVAIFAYASLVDGGWD